MISSTSFLPNPQQVTANRFGALHSDGTLSCWGFNGYGELGDGVDAGDSHVPITVPNVSNVVAFDNGGGYVIVQRTDGSLWAWGLNTYGQLGNGTTTNAACANQDFFEIRARST